MTPDPASARPESGASFGAASPFDSPTLAHGRPLDRLFALERFGIKLGLDNIRTLTAALGRPQDAFQSIHIAGTNGKGSTTAMVERALRDAGYRTGRYTSPHLDRIEERVAIDGRPAGAELFVEVAEQVLDLADRLRRDGALETSPTFFEVTTAIAFEIFRRAGVEIGVIEVGLGGRFDATNVITPEVTAITSIAFDHERHLGASLASIAFEKAGILKSGVPAVIGEMPSDAARVIEEVAAVTGAPLVRAGLELVMGSWSIDGRATMTVETPVGRYSDVRLGLPGAHQVANAVVAIRVLELAQAAGMRLKPEHIVAGMRDVKWPARLEWLRLENGHELLLDAAHNPSGAEALARYLAESGVAPIPIVLAVMKDKDVDGIVRPLARVASRFIATAAGTERSLAATELEKHIQGAGGGVPVEGIADPDVAVRIALRHAPRVAAAGSIFFVGPLRARLVAAGAVSSSH